METNCVFCEGANEILYNRPIWLYLMDRSSASIPDQSPWDVWWTNWRWDKFSSDYFGFPLSVSFHQCSIPIFFNTLLLAEEQKSESWDPSKK